MKVATTDAGRVVLIAVAKTTRLAARLHRGLVRWLSGLADSMVAMTAARMVAQMRVAGMVVKMAAARVVVTARLMVVTKAASWAYSKVVSRDIHLAFPQVAELVVKTGGMVAVMIVVMAAQGWAALKVGGMVLAMVKWSVAWSVDLWAEMVSLMVAMKV